MSRRRAAVLLLALLPAARPAGAQGPAEAWSLGGSTALRADTAGASSQVRLSARRAWRPHPALQLSAGGEVTGSIGDGGTAGRALVTAGAAGRRGPLDGWIDVAGGGATTGATHPLVSAGAGLALELAGSALGVVVRSTAFHVPGPRLRAVVRPGPDTGTVTRWIANPHVGPHRYTDAELTWSRQVGGLALRAVGGARIQTTRVARDRWARGEVSLPLGPALLDVGLGTRPATPELRVGRGWTLTVGARLAPAARRAAAGGGSSTGAAELRVAAAGGAHRLRVRIPGAARVRVKGDLTDWLPAELAPLGDGWWELPAPLRAGVYHVNLQWDDGPWSVPPGLPRLRDEFGGEVTVVVVP